MKPMESKNYNLTTKLIIPLLDDNITLEDVSEKSGFIGAYNYDINRPYLENHIFLMYKSIDTIECLNRYQKFNKLDTIYNKTYITIKGEHYIVYTFVKTNNEINKILKCGQCFNPKNSLKINNFWKNIDNDMFQRLFAPQFEYSKKINDVLPEEDYYSYVP